MLKTNVFKKYFILFFISISILLVIYFFGTQVLDNSITVSATSNSSATTSVASSTIIYSDEVFKSSISLPTLSLIPSVVVQGEPVLVQIDGVNISDIKQLDLAGNVLNIFDYIGKPSALYGVDLNKKPGIYNFNLILNNGSSTSQSITIVEREKYQTSMPVPDSVGGNSVANQTKVVNTLADENAILAVIKTGLKAFWSKPFIYPISNPIVTDPYGYSRDTGNYVITHKGVDLKANDGTEVHAMNRGVVRIARSFTVYGNMIVIDHGFGVMTFYIHLSKINVNVGQLVEQGQIIGLSGHTGYSTGPHLHITVRINNISIDPVKFLDIFN